MNYLTTFVFMFDGDCAILYCLLIMPFKLEFEITGSLITFFWKTNEKLQSKYSVSTQFTLLQLASKPWQVSKYIPISFTWESRSRTSCWTTPNSPGTRSEHTPQFVPLRASSSGLDKCSLWQNSCLWSEKKIIFVKTVSAIFVCFWIGMR